MKLRLLLAAVVLASTAGCQSIAYYTQAIGGHLRVLSLARPVDEWLADPSTDPTLRERLRTAQRIRAFATQRLKLPDNASYASYAELDRSYVVWNVFAAGIFSVEPRKECFPFTGCVSYRGFYSEEAARRHAEKLRQDGNDVYIGGVPAYSTLGWFDDPLLSTFIRYPDAQLARLVFHELAHQVAYARNDTTFNESFAVAVEEYGVKLWLEAEGRPAELEAFQASQARRRAFAARVSETRERLEAIYASDLPSEEMRAKKREEWERLRAAYPGIPAEPNNAFLVSIAVYTELVPAFRQMLAESESLETFYARVKELAAAKQSARDDYFTKAGYPRSS